MVGFAYADTLFTAIEQLLVDKIYVTRCLPGEYPIDLLDPTADDQRMQTIRSDTERGCHDPEVTHFITEVLRVRHLPRRAARCLELPTVTVENRLAKNPDSRSVSPETGEAGRRINPTSGVMS
jgi:hypothetical protein